MEDKERIAVVEAQLKWMAPIVERTENKVDLLIEKSSFRWGMVIGVSGLVSILVELISRR